MKFEGFRVPSKIGFVIRGFLRVCANLQGRRRQKVKTGSETSAGYQDGKNCIHVQHSNM